MRAQTSSVRWNGLPITHHIKTPLVQKLGKAAKNRDGVWVTARNVKVRLTTDALAEGLSLIDDLDHLLPRHTLKTSALTVGEDIAMFATLIAFIRNMPLEGKRRLFASWDSLGRC